MRSIGLYILLICLMMACNSSNQQPGDIKPYEGPLQEADDLELFYSESATLKVKLITDKLLEYANGDRKFPEGLYLEFYNETGQLTTTLKANEAFYFKEEDKWRGRGNVELKSIENNQQLDTEELFWKPDKEKMYTDKFVTIKLPDQILYGKGLEAKQDFSSYEITKPEGVFYLEDEDE